jgi:hypothetical protein
MQMHHKVIVFLSAHAASAAQAADTDSFFSVTVTVGVHNLCKDLTTLCVLVVPAGLAELLS